MNTYTFPLLGKLLPDISQCPQLKEKSHCPHFFKTDPPTHTLTNMKLFTKINSHVLLRSHKKVVFIYYQMTWFKENLSSSSDQFAKRTNEPVNVILPNSYEEIFAKTGKSDCVKSGNNRF